MAKKPQNWPKNSLESTFLSKIVKTFQCSPDLVFQAIIKIFVSGESSDHLVSKLEWPLILAFKQRPQRPLKFEKKISSPNKFWP